MRNITAQMAGNYFCDEATLAQQRRDNRIVFRYASADGQITACAVQVDLNRSGAVR